MRTISPTLEPLAYDAKRLAAVLSISVDAARKLMNGPLYPKRFHIGRRVLIRREAVEEFLITQEGE